MLPIHLLNTVFRFCTFSIKLKCCVIDDSWLNEINRFDYVGLSDKHTHHLHYINKNIDIFHEDVVFLVIKYDTRIYIIQKDNVNIYFYYLPSYVRDKLHDKSELTVNIVKFYDINYKDVQKYIDTL